MYKINITSMYYIYVYIYINNAHNSRTQRPENESRDNEFSDFEK